MGTSETENLYNVDNVDKESGSLERWEMFEKWCGLPIRLGEMAEMAEMAEMT